jgi:hypothetical protein
MENFLVMSADRPWYREPETFIAVAALIVSVSAVVVGIYEASLQRAHDRAEVWPHVELSTYVTPKGAALYLENNGIGPALIKSITVRVDGRPQHNWAEVLQRLLGRPASQLENSTVRERAVRAGDRVTLVGIPTSDMPPSFWKSIGRVSVAVCYSSVFDEHWTVTDVALGGSSVWAKVKGCPAQAPDAEF